MWYSEKSKIAGPLAQHMPVPAIEFECGPKGTKKAFDLTYTAVRRFIEANRSGQEVCGDKNVEFTMSMANCMANMIQLLEILC